MTPHGRCTPSSHAAIEGRSKWVAAMPRKLRGPFVSVTALLELEWVMRVLRTPHQGRGAGATGSFEHRTHHARGSRRSPGGARRVRHGPRFRGRPARGAKLACVGFRDFRPTAGKTGKKACAGATCGVAGLMRPERGTTGRHWRPADRGRPVPNHRIAPNDNSVAQTRSTPGSPGSMKPSPANTQHVAVLERHRRAGIWGRRHERGCGDESEQECCAP
jgi:hypothetical protein